MKGMAGLEDKDWFNIIQHVNIQDVIDSNNQYTDDILRRAFQKADTFKYEKDVSLPKSFEQGLDEVKFA